MELQSGSPFTVNKIMELQNGPPFTMNGIMCLAAEIIRISKWKFCVFDVSNDSADGNNKGVKKYFPEVACTAYQTLMNKHKADQKIISFIFEALYPLWIESKIDDLMPSFGERTIGEIVGHLKHLVGHSTWSLNLEYNNGRSVFWEIIGESVDPQASRFDLSDLFLNVVENLFDELRK